MKNSVISKIKLNKNDNLNSIVKKNGLYSIVLRFLSVLLSFWSIRVAFEFTGSQQIYGLWLTILSVISWLGLLNGGMGNGLRNKLSEAIATNNISHAKTYVSTSYIFISILAISSCLIFAFVTVFVDWRVSFNASYIPKTEFTMLFSIIVISYFFQIILSTLNAICFAHNHSTLPSLFLFFSNVLYVMCLYILKIFDVKGLIILGITYCTTTLVVLIIANIYLFSDKYSNIRPSLSFFDRKYIKSLIGNGTKFFLLEVAAMVIFTTDSLIINHVAGSQEVATYQLVMKLFNLFLIISGAVMVPLWSAYTHAYSTGDIEWIKRTLKKLLLITGIIFVSIIIFSFFINPILNIWMNNKIIASNLLISVIAGYTIINIWSNLFAYFLNGTGKIKGQLITVVSGAIVNVPLSLFLSKNLSWGATGVVVGTIISLLPFAILGPINSYIVIKKASKSF